MSVAPFANKSQVSVAILGATGAVGRQMLTCLEERNIPVSELRLLASARSAGMEIPFNGGVVSVQEATPQSFEGIDIVLGAAENDIALELLPHAVAAGCTVIDNSSAYRLDPNVPLVIPEINPEDAFENQGIIANPNCATIIGLVCVWPLAKNNRPTRIIASTYQAASGAGMPGIAELEAQNAAIVAGEPVPAPHTFAHQLAWNLIPQIGGFGENGYTSEEMKMQNEGRKIMHLPELRVNCTCVRVPIARSHSESITVEFEKPLTVAEARALLAAAPGIKLVDEPEEGRYPMPLDTTNQDLVYVGRVREDISAAEGVPALTFWCCGDQIRKGAATNAVQIAELLLGREVR
jgi:aspartate-semialdehyde dehydrogenase